MPTKATDEAQAKTSKDLQSVENHLIEALGIEKEIKTQKAPERPTEQLQNQLTPVDKEILKIEKKVREIEKLQEKKAAGETLDKMQEEKIERAGEIGLKLSQLYSTKFIEEQKSAAVVTVAAEPQAQPLETATPQLQDLPFPVSEAPKKKHARKGTKETKSVHIPVVVPPRVKAKPVDVEIQNATEELIQHQMWASPVEVADNGENIAEDEDDFEMVPLEAPAPAFPQQFEWAAQEWDTPEFCEEIVGGQPKGKDDCWEWVTKGHCPRGSYCRWKHKPLATGGAAETSVFALNFNLDSDDDTEW